MLYSVYILQGLLKRKHKSTFYIGETSNLDKRLQAHEGGRKKGGALRTSMMKDIAIVYHEEFSTLKEAMKEERRLKKEFKKMKRADKIKYIKEHSEQSVAS